MGGKISHGIFWLITAGGRVGSKSVIKRREQGRFAYVLFRAESRPFPWAPWAPRELLGRDDCYPLGLVFLDVPQNSQKTVFGQFIGAARTPPTPIFYENSDFYKNRIFDKNRVFNLVWAGFEAGFELSVKNHADPYPQIMIWPKFLNFHKNPLKTIKFH